jgi:AcrR family transcriptional regulator
MHKSSTSAPPFYVIESDPPAKREIVRAALALFSERGLAATSIRDIAEKSGYTNPALYKHFASKDELAQDLFDRCHQHVWSRCAARLSGDHPFDAKLEAYIGEWFAIIDEHPEVFAFLSDSARVLWPTAGAMVKKRTMINLARSLMREAPGLRHAHASAIDMAAASLQGTIAEIARMIHVGVLEGPATRWTSHVTALLRKVGS